MPVDPTNPYTDQAHPSTVVTTEKYTCHNRPSVAPYWAEFQDGWKEDQTRNMVKHLVNFKEGVDCGYNPADRIKDQRCKDCRWQLV
jgi:hypothetical protein